VKNIVVEPVYNTTEIIGNSTKIGALEIAEFDIPYTMTSVEAENACIEIGDGWRLPTVEELGVIFGNRDKIKGLKEKGYYYWSSTKTELGESKVSYYDSMMGFYIGYKNKRLDEPRVRIVRTVTP
jgi:hypothetical protein